MRFARGVSKCCQNTTRHSIIEDTMISYEDFIKTELRVGTIRAAERVEGSDKLIRFSVDVGETDEAGIEKPRQIVAGIGKGYTPEDLISRQIVVVINLEPRKLMGLESQGMLLAAGADVPVLLTPDREVPPGSTIK
ncbi:MAG: methionine--tRNA ligase subunit beta [Patescibacteria group bacterium]